MGFPLHKPYPYSLYRWGFLHFRYLKCSLTWMHPISCFEVLAANGSYRYIYNTLSLCVWHFIWKKLGTKTENILQLHRDSGVQKCNDWTPSDWTNLLQSFIYSENSLGPLVTSLLIGIPVCQLILPPNNSKKQKVQPTEPSRWCLRDDPWVGGWFSDPTKRISKFGIWTCWKNI